MSFFSDFHNDRGGYRDVEYDREGLGNSNRGRAARPFRGMNRDMRAEREESSRFIDHNKSVSMNDYRRL